MTPKVRDYDPAGLISWERALRRFRGKFEQRGPDECWIWEGSKDRDGYGRFKFNGYAYAHRFAFLVEHGYWPSIARHSCDTPACVNHAHILAWPPQDGSRRGGGGGEAERVGCRRHSIALRRRRDSDRPGERVRSPSDVRVAHHQTNQLAPRPVSAYPSTSTTERREMPTATETKRITAPKAGPVPPPFVDPDAGDSYWRIFLYGAPKAGKSAGAASAPGPCLILNSEGGQSLSFVREKYGKEKIREVAINTLADLDAAEVYIRAGMNGEKTIIVDSLGSLHARLMEHYSGGGKKTLPMYGDVQTRVERLWNTLRNAPAHVILVAHEMVIEDRSDAGGFERMPLTGTSSPILGAKLMADCDIVGYVGRIDPPADADPGTPPRYLAQLVDGKGRRGGDRSNALGRTRDLRIEEWLEAIRQHRAGTNQKTEN